MARSFRYIILIIPFWIIQLSTYGQNYIGIHKDDIKKLTSKEYKGFIFEKEVKNGDRSFIKFVNVIDEQTLLFMLNQEGICTSVSRMYNTWLYDQVVKELKENYKKVGSDTWTEVKDGKEYEIKLKHGEWFITVTTRPITKK
ncbi:hypothetical protein CYCD_25080 [Tenuifilaceae bacterium CYCD]|nr:hypothetical protein CYCD_25080 [Tenuifilaceae bacterium CYCD]